MVLQLQFIIFFWILGGLIVLTVLLALAERFLGDDYGMLGGFGFSAVFTGVFAGITLIILVLSAIPFNSKYWYITYTSGTVTSTTYHGGVVIDGGSGTVYVLELDGKPRQYVVNDNKATALKTGDHADLACTIQWNYAAMDTYNCSIAN